MTQMYQAPNADLSQNQTSDVSLLLEPLQATKPWVRFFSVLGFIATFFTLFAAIVLFFSGSQIPGLPISTIWIAMLYLLAGVLYFFASLYLWQYASCIAKALISKQLSDVVDALSKQKSFWLLIGIITLVMMLLFVLAFVAGIAIAFSR